MNQKRKLPGRYCVCGLLATSYGMDSLVRCPNCFNTWPHSLTERSSDDGGISTWSLPQPKEPALVYSEIGLRVMAWRRKNFGVQSRMRNVLQLVEECGEACEAKHSQENFKKELADSLLALAALSVSEGCILLPPDDIHEGVTTDSLFCLVGKLARVVGKEDEGIRPESRGSVEPILCRMAGVLEMLFQRRYSHSASLRLTVYERIQRMESLDFTKDPEGGER